MHVPKTAEMNTVEGGVLVRELYLKRHNFGRRESFPRLVDIPRMCLLYVSFGGRTYGLGAIKPRKNPNFGRRCRRLL